MKILALRRQEQLLQLCVTTGVKVF